MKEAEEEERKAEELKKELESYEKRYIEMKRLVREGKIEEASKLAREILQYYESINRSMW